MWDLTAKTVWKWNGESWLCLWGTNGGWEWHWGWAGVTPVMWHCPEGTSGASSEPAFNPRLRELCLVSAQPHSPVPPRTEVLMPLHRLWAMEVIKTQIKEQLPVLRVRTRTEYSVCWVSCECQALVWCLQAEYWDFEHCPKWWKAKLRCECSEQHHQLVGGLFLLYFQQITLSEPSLTALCLEIARKQLILT